LKDPCTFSLSKDASGVTGVTVGCEEKKINVALKHERKVCRQRLDPPLAKTRKERATRQPLAKTRTEGAARPHAEWQAKRPLQFLPFSVYFLALQENLVTVNLGPASK